MRPTEVEALRDVKTCGAKLRDVIRCLDALGDDLEPELVSEPDGRTNDRGRFTDRSGGTQARLSPEPCLVFRRAISGLIPSAQSACRWIYRAGRLLAVQPGDDR